MTTFHIRSAVLNHYSEVVEELGGIPSELMTKAQLNPEVLNDPDARVSHTAFIDLLEVSSRDTGCFHLGLLLGVRAGLQQLGMLGLLVRSAPDLGTAIRELNKHLALHARGIRRELHCQGPTAFITNHFDSVKASCSTQAIQMSLAMTWRICQLISQNSWHPSSISFTFAVPSDRRFYERFFQVPVRFNSDFNGIVFQSDDLKLALNGSDAYLHEEIKFQLSRLKDEETADFLVLPLFQWAIFSDLCQPDTNLGHQDESR